MVAGFTASCVASSVPSTFGLLLWVKLRLGDRLQRPKRIHTGVVDQHIQPAELTHYVFEELLHIGTFLETSPCAANAFAAPFRILRHNPVRAFVAGSIVHHISMGPDDIPFDRGPAAANPFAIPAPIPFEVPVTRATLPWKTPILVPPRFCSRVVKTVRAARAVLPPGVFTAGDTFDAGTILAYRRGAKPGPYRHQPRWSAQ